MPTKWGETRERAPVAPGHPTRAPARQARGRLVLQRPVHLSLRPWRADRRRALIRRGAYLFRGRFRHATPALALIGSGLAWTEMVLWSARARIGFPQELRPRSRVGVTEPCSRSQRADSSRRQERVTSTRRRGSLPGRADQCVRLAAGAPRLLRGRLLPGAASASPNLSLPPDPLPPRGDRISSAAKNAALGEG